MVFSRSLQLHYKVCCDITTEAGIVRFSLTTSTMTTFSVVSDTRKFQGIPWIWGCGWVGIRSAISHKLGDIELRSQMTINHY